MTESKIELLPCPFCGGEAKMNQYHKMGYEIKCTSCAIRYRQKVLYKPLEWLEAKMIENWNTRIETTSPGYWQKRCEAGTELLTTILNEELKKFKINKDAADWFNNNTDGVGQTIDYQSYPPMPKWAENVISFLKSSPPQTK